MPDKKTYENICVGRDLSVLETWRIRLGTERVSFVILTSDKLLQPPKRSSNVMVSALTCERLRLPAYECYRVSQVKTGLAPREGRGGSLDVPFRRWIVLVPRLVGIESIPSRNDGPSTWSQNTTRRKVEPSPRSVTCIPVSFKYVAPFCILTWKCIACWFVVIRGRTAKVGYDSALVLCFTAKRWDKGQNSIFRHATLSPSMVVFEFHSKGCYSPFQWLRSILLPLLFRCSDTINNLKLLDLLLGFDQRF